MRNTNAKLIASSQGLEKNKTIRILSITEKIIKNILYKKKRNIDFKKKTLIYFDQIFSSQRNLVDNLSLSQFNFIDKKLLQNKWNNFFIKAHPGKTSCHELSKIKNLKISG